MDAFENVVATLLERSGYWVRASYKVELTKEEKRRIGKASLPRPEIDLLAYRAADNRVLAVECKSYLDSGGVAMSAFDGSNEAFARRFKLFNDDNWREIVESRLLQQLTDCGMCLPGATVVWALAAGKIKSPADRATLGAHFADRGWELWDAEWIGAQLESLAAGGYENDVVSIVAKLLHRRAGERRTDNKRLGSKGGRGRSGPRSVGRAREDDGDVPAPDVAYRFSRLCFKADLIEPLRPDQSFRVVTPVGTFQMTKAEFDRDFGNITATRSYREHGIYHYPKVPRAAERYRIDTDQPTSGDRH